MSLSLQLLKSTHVILQASKAAYCLASAKSKTYSTKAESFLSGSNANFLEAQYLDWAKSKGGIDASWDQFYESVTGPALKIEEFENEFSPTTVRPKKGDKSKDEEKVKQSIKLHLAVQNLIRSYQTRGHLLARTDPLGLMIGAKHLLKTTNISMDKTGLQCRMVARELGTILCEQHMDMEFELPDRTFIGGKESRLTLRLVQLIT